MTTPPDFDRDSMLARLRAGRQWDLAVIGGGATGLGIALDAAARGLSVTCVESHDFAEGTSSRATKLVHGGVRYLARGDLALVREALRERAAMLANAPHLAQSLAFVMPGHRWWERAFYGAGLKAYDMLAGARGIGRTEWLSTREVRELLPGVRTRGLWGGVRYWDGQFDDARYAVALARTAAAHGAVVLNRCAAVELLRQDDRIAGLVVEDREGGERLRIAARCVVNAAGVWVDAVRALDHAPGEAPPPPMVAPSQGVHLVVDRDFLPGDNALLVPKTADGRVLFAVPWLGKVVLGTTDTPRPDPAREPAPFGDEVRFILDEAGRYLSRAPGREDVRSIWVGLRPLVKPEHGDGSKPEELSREHTVQVGRSGLVTVTGGKWTTYRAMAEDVLDRCMADDLLPRRPGGVTRHLSLIGSAPGRSLAEPPGRHLYGAEAEILQSLPGADRWLWRDGGGGLSEAMVRFAARHEMARCVADVLARRSRLLFLDAAAAAGVAEDVAEILRGELRRDVDAAAFVALAAQYRRLP